MNPTAQLPRLPDGPYTPAELADRETRIRAAVAAYASSLVGIVANPTAADDGWSRYLDLIAPVEVAAGNFARASDMALMSGCGLVMRGILRACLRNAPRVLTGPYVTGQAVADVMRIALDAGAVREPPFTDAPPRVGDVVRVAVPEHVWMIVSVSDRADGRGWDAEGVEGGERTAGGYETIVRRSRELRRVGARALDIVSGGPTRAVLNVYDMGEMLRVYGVDDAMAPED